MMNTSRITILAFLGSFVIAAAAWADTLPAHYPSSFNRWGNIDRIDIARGDIVINDMLMHIAENVRIHTPHIRFATVHALGKGVKIGYTFSTTSPVSRLIDEIWLLPKDYGTGTGDD